jgi:hypothetical protein
MLTTSERREPLMGTWTPALDGYESMTPGLLLLEDAE